MADAPGADLARLKRMFAEAEQLSQESRRNSLKAIDYYDSDQFTREELARLEQRGQPAIVINRIKPAINGMIGVTERGRSNPRAWPRQPQQGDASDVATDILRYIADFNRFARTKQDCFKDMLVPGTCAALVGVDSDLQVTITQIRWEELFHDPRSRRADFADARYLGLAKWMYADDAASLWPDQAAEIEAAIGAGVGVSVGETLQDRPSDGGAGVWVDPRQRRVLVVEAYHRHSGVWMRSCHTGATVLEHGPSPYLDARGRPDCPIVAMSAYVRRDNGRYGAVWDMIGPQDEINKRRSKSVHLLSVTRLEMRDPSAIDTDADLARREAARPDGVIPFGWGLAPNTADFQGNMEMMSEAKAEIERMAPSPALLGRIDVDASGRALIARQQSSLTELANLYGALEDFELRIYRQCWARVKQFWTAPMFIRVTDDENAPRFVGINQTGPTTGPQTGDEPAPTAPGVLGYVNRVAEMDVDIEIESQTDVANIAQEQFAELLQLVRMSPAYQQQAPLSLLIQLSNIPHKRSILDRIEQTAQSQAAQAVAREAIAGQHAQAQIEKTRTEAQRNLAQGTAQMLNALSEAHAVHADLTNAASQAHAGQADVERAMWGEDGA